MTAEPKKGEEKLRLKLTAEVKKPVSRKQAAISAVLLIMAVYFDEVISKGGFSVGIPEIGVGPNLIVGLLGEYALWPWRWLVTFLLITTMAIFHRRPKVRWLLAQVTFLTAVFFLLSSLYNAAQVLWVQHADQIIKLLESAGSSPVKG